MMFLTALPVPTTRVQEVLIVVLWQTPRPRAKTLVRVHRVVTPPLTLIVAPRLAMIQESR